jgi:hypothetical protein
MNIEASRKIIDLEYWSSGVLGTKRNEFRHSFKVLIDPLLQHSSTPSLPEKIL